MKLIMHREIIWFVFAFENCYYVLFIFEIIIISYNGLPWQSLCAFVYICTERVQSLCLLPQVKIEHSWKLVKNTATVVNVLWTSRTWENMNRKFWKCKGCGTFEWDDDQKSSESNDFGGMKDRNMNENKIDILLGEVGKLGY